MRRKNKTLFLCTVILLVGVCLTYGASEYLFKSVSSPSMSEDPALDIASVKGEGIENANGTINEAYGKQGDVIAEASKEDPKVEEIISAATGHGNYSGGGSSHSGGGYSGGGYYSGGYSGSSTSGSSSGGSTGGSSGGSSGGGSSSGGDSGGWWPTDGDYECEQGTEVYNYCSSCGSKYMGDGDCPYCSHGHTYGD